MATRDLLNNIHPVRALSPASVADNAAQVSQIIDTRGYDSLTFLIATGSIVDTNATFAVKVDHSDASDLSGSVAVADAELVGTEALAGFQFDDDNEIRKVGYVGSKRYVRLTITPTGNAAAAFLASIAVLGHAHTRPTSNPPA